MNKAYAVLAICVILTSIFSYFYFFTPTLPEIPYEPPVLPPPTSSKFPLLEFAIWGDTARLDSKGRTIRYNEYESQFDYSYAYADLIHCIQSYLLTGNSTHLELAEKTATTLNAFEILFATGETSVQDIDGDWGKWFAFSGYRRALSLLILAEQTRSSAYRQKCVEILDWLCQQQPPKDIMALSQRVILLSYGYHVIGDSKYKDKAWSLIQGWKLGASGLPAMSTGVSYTKEDAGFGVWGIMLFLYKRFTGHDISSFIYEQHKIAAKALWTGDHFAYRADINTGQPLSGYTYPVHGFGTIDLTMIWAYLEFGDREFLDKAKQDWIYCLIDPGVLCSSLNLIYHAPAYHDATFYWNRYAILPGLLLYKLTGDTRIKTKTEAIFDAFNYYKRKYGLVLGVDGDTGAISTRTLHGGRHWYYYDAPIDLTISLFGQMYEPNMHPNDLKYWFAIVP